MHPARALLNCLSILTVATTLAGCEREERRFREMPPSASTTNTVSLSPLQPGPTLRVVETRSPYEENAYIVSEGKALYNSMNCVGCHANGGGGMGPALTDDEWIYGSEPDQIFATIAQGRPHGMPAWQYRLSNDQIWRLVAYVRSLSGQLRKDVETTRSDDMQSGPSEQRRKKVEPKRSTTPSQ